MAVSKKQGAAAAIAAAVALAAPFVAGWEGHSTTPHWDAIGKTWDVCYGDRVAKKRTYTDAECMALLKKRLGDYAAPVLKRNPELGSAPYQLAAATSLAYNIGPATYARSSIARNFSAGNWRAACDAFPRYSYSNGVYVQGLRNRREAERKLCLKGL